MRVSYNSRYINIGISWGYIVTIAIAGRAPQKTRIIKAMILFLDESRKSQKSQGTARRQEGSERCWLKKRLDG